MLEEVIFFYVNVPSWRNGEDTRGIKVRILRWSGIGFISMFVSLTFCFELGTMNAGSFQTILFWSRICTRYCKK